MFPLVTTTSPTLQLSGLLRNGKYVIRVNDVELGLTHSLFEFIVELVRVRLTTRTGLTSPPHDVVDKAALHATVRRLRRALDDSLGDGYGAALVVHAGRSCYFLDIPPKSITIDPAVTELEHHLSAGVLADLRGLLVGS